MSNYKEEYNKIHYKQVKTYLKLDEYEKLKNVQKETGMNNADVIRWALKKLLKENDNKLSNK